MKKAAAWMLCLFLVFSVLAVGLAGEAEVAGEEELIVPNIVPAKGIEDFIGEWNFCWVVYEDGAVNKLPEAQPEDPANMIISEDKVLLYAAGDSIGSVKPEFIPEDGSMRMIREDGTKTNFKLSEEYCDSMGNPTDVRVNWIIDGVQNRYNGGGAYVGKGLALVYNFGCILGNNEKVKIEANGKVYE